MILDILIADQEEVIGEYGFSWRASSSRLHF
jgi:hypothetical protein